MFRHHDRMKDQSSVPLYAPQAISRLRAVLTELGWELASGSEDNIFFVDFGPSHIPVAEVMAAISFESPRFVIYFNFGVDASAARRDEVARFITRANWGLLSGNFEMDYDDGHVRFKSSVDFNHTELSETLIRNAILSGMKAVEKYADALVEVLSGRKDAAQAIKDAEAE